jgi:hypothetical protein
MIAQVEVETFRGTGKGFRLGDFPRDLLSQIVLTDCNPFVLFTDA